MKIYLDFDRTLFDCDQFLGDLYQIIKKYNIPKKVFKDCQILCKKEGFNPHNILEKVDEISSFNHGIYQDINELLKNTSSYLYSDTISFLNYLKNKHYEIIILTKGNLVYQKEKIINAHIENYYSDLIITMKHKGNLDIDYKNSIFIDDNPNEIKSILRRKPKVLIRIKRMGSKYDYIVLENNFKTISSLQQIIDNELL